MMINAIVLICLLVVSTTAVEQFDATSVDRCTTMVTGRKAGKHGPMATHTADCLDCDFRVNKVPAADHPPGSVRNIYLFKGDYPQTLTSDRGATWQPSNLEGSDEQKASWGSLSDVVMTIPEVAHTYAIFEGQYGIMNEHQLAMGESTCAARFWAAPPIAGGKARIEVKELSKIALERCKTARCAIALMGELAETYGYYTADWTGGDMSKGEGGEALSVIDTEEAWVFHILSDDTGASAVWVAQRVPDDHIAVVANSFVIRKINPALRGKDFLYSDNIFEVARRNNLWKPSEGHLDFLPTYSPMRAHAIYSTRRVWRVFSLAAPSIKLPAHTNAYADDYPFSVPVDTVLDEDDLIRFNSDHYEGSQFDLTKGVQAGPFGDPARFDVAPVDGMTIAQALQGSYQRAISMFRTSYSFVATARKLKTDLLARVWFSQYQPSTSSYLPVYIAADLPVEFTRGSLFKYDNSIPFWNYLAANNYASRFYKYAILDVFALKDSLHAKVARAASDFEAMVNGIPSSKSAVSSNVNATTDSGSDRRTNDISSDSDETSSDKIVFDDATTSAILAKMNELGVTNMASIVQGWRDLLPALITKFHDGYIASIVDNNINMQKLFYPKWWLTASGYFLEPPESGKDVIMFEPSPEEVAQAKGLSSGGVFLFMTLMSLVSLAAGYVWGQRSGSKVGMQTPSDLISDDSYSKSWFPSLQMSSTKLNRGYTAIDNSA